MQSSVIFTTVSLSTPFDIVFIATTVTLNAVFKLPNAFFKVFAPNIGWRVLMASITGVPLVVIQYMAGDTTGRVITV